MQRTTVIAACSYLLMAAPIQAQSRSADLDGNGCVDLRDYAVFQGEFGNPRCTGPLFAIDLVEVPGGSPGPEYTFLIGKYTVTNAQFATFLNDAQLDAGATRRGSFMAFELDGRVTTHQGDPMAKPIGTPYSSWPYTRLMYNGAEPPGERYRVQIGFEQHPMTGASWIGAVKFCNWLTIDQGMSPEDLCYTEGPDVLHWYPVTTNWSISQLSDLMDLQRTALVTNCRGFRLPMDNCGLEVGYFGKQENTFNEWYKAAVYDPEAPDFARTGLNGELISPYHWMYGYGRDTVAFSYANFRDSFDPFEYGTTPVRYYDGANWLADNAGTTTDTNNFFGAYDFAGNVREWVQDWAFMRPYRAVRGGGHLSYPAGLAASNRERKTLTSLTDRIGFRVARVP